MKKQSVLIPCHAQESTGDYMSNDGRSLAHVKDVDAVEHVNGMLTVNPKRVFFIEEVRYWFNLYTKQEITIGKLTEFLNEKALGISELELYKIEQTEFLTPPNADK